MSKLNQPRVYIPIFIITGIVLIVALFFVWHTNAKEDESLSIKKQYHSNKYVINENNKQITEDRAAIQKIEDNPSALEKKGIEKVKKYLNVAYQQQNKSSDETKKEYNIMLKNDIDKNIRDSEEFRKIFAPKDYNLYPGVIRGSTIDIYVENKGNDKAFTNDMTITYDLSSDQITNFKTYRDRGDQ